jgi:hypothetical protein
VKREGEAQVAAIDTELKVLGIEPDELVDSVPAAAAERLQGTASGRSLDRMHNLSRPRIDVSGVLATVLAGSPIGRDRVRLPYIG